APHDAVRDGLGDPILLRREAPQAARDRRGHLVAARLPREHAAHAERDRSDDADPQEAPAAEARAALVTRHRSLLRHQVEGRGVARGVHRRAADYVEVDPDVELAPADRAVTA